MFSIPLGLVFSSIGAAYCGLEIWIYGSELGSARSVPCIGDAGLTLVLPGRRRNTGIPAVFVLCSTAILYGFVVGIVVRRRRRQFTDC